MSRVRAATGALQALQFVGGVYCVNTYGFEVTQCEGPSMLPTLHEKGDLLLVNKLSLRFSPLKRAEVVVCKSPTRSGQYVCKRVVGVAGDVVRPGGRGRRVHVPAGHLWIEGDNAANSTDSRLYGCVPLSLVEGRVTHKVWPLDEAKSL